jgi:hypothetical protein
VFGVVVLRLNPTVLAMNVFVKKDILKLVLINSEEEFVQIEESANPFFLIFFNHKLLYHSNLDDLSFFTIPIIVHHLFL